MWAFNQRSILIETGPMVRKPRALEKIVEKLKMVMIKKNFGMKNENENGEKN